MFTAVDDQVVEKSLAMNKAPSAFVDTDQDGIPNEVHFDGDVIPVTIASENTIGFSFEDGAKMAYYPSTLEALPRSGTYEVLGFLHHWDAGANRFVAILLHQHENYETSDGVTIYIIDRAGIRVGSLFYTFMEKAFLRYTPPYKQWLDTGYDFAVGSSPLASNYAIIGKELGLMDTVLVINLSLTTEAVPPGQDLVIRANEPEVIGESLSQLGAWGAFGGDGGEGSIFSSINVKGEVVSGRIDISKAQGFSYRNGRNTVFYPTDLNSLPAPIPTGINWELLGFLHYFSDDGSVNTTLAVVLGQRAGDETSLGALVRFIDNAGLEVGSPMHKFFPRRDVTAMGTFKRWQETGNSWALGRRDGADNTLYITWDLGIIDKILVMSFLWY
jgi:hypothetical protein